MRRRSSPRSQRRPNTTGCTRGSGGSSAAAASSPSAISMARSRRSRSLEIGGVVQLRAQFEESRAQPLIAPRSQLLPQRGIFRHLDQPVAAQHGIQIQAGAADENGSRPRRPDVGKDREKTALKSKDAERRARIEDVDQVVGDRAVFAQILAGADIEAAENLARIGGNNLAVKALGKRHPKAGLAGGGGTEDDDEIGGVCGHLSPSGSVQETRSWAGKAGHNTLKKGKRRCWGEGDNERKMRP